MGLGDATKSFIQERSRILAQAGGKVKALWSDTDGSYNQLEVR